jgi:hypothetical protein
MLPRCPHRLPLQALLTSLALLLLPPCNAVAADTPPASSDPEQQRALLQQRSQLEQRIEELQQGNGAGQQSSLQEARLALGRLLQELQQHEAASRVFDATWQALRADNGLQDPAQLPILRRLFASQRAAQQWSAADDTAHLIQHIASRSYAPGSPERMEAVLLLGRWKLLAARDDLLPNAFATAFQASELYRNELKALQALETGNSSHLQLATLYLEKASAEYLLASEVDAQPLQEYFLGGQRTTTMLQCQSIRFPDGSTQRICMPTEVPNLDYYVDPSNRKHQDIARFLGEMRADITAAFNELVAEEAAPEQRQLLLDDMQGLTQLYNDFATRGQRRL